MRVISALYSFVFILSFFNANAKVDDKHQIDSLQLVIESDVHDTIRVGAYQTWDDLIYYKDPLLDQELNFKITTICAENLNKQLHPKEELFFKKAQAKTFNNLALILKRDGNLEQALDYHEKSLAIYQELDEKKGIALVSMNIGSISHVQGDLITALKYYYESLKIYEDLDYPKGKAGAYNNIGAIYHYQGEYIDAIKFYSESLKTYEELNIPLKAGRNYSNIGLVYYEQGDSLEDAGFIVEGNKKYDQALESMIQALNIFKENESKLDIGMVYNNIGTVYYAKKKLDIALDYFTMSYSIKEEQHNTPEMASSLANIANIYFEKGNYSQAKKEALMAYELAKESNSIVEINSSAQILYKIFKQQNQSNEALKFHEIYTSTMDSLRNENNNKLTIQQQFKYEYDKKAAADSIVQAEAIKVKNAEIAAKNAESENHKLVIARQREQKYYLFGGIALVALFGLFMANRVVFIQRQKKIIEQQKSEVTSQKNQIELQHHQLEETHKEISDSIKYAQRLQAAILPEMDDLNSELKDGFVLFQPKDVVSGDFYWMQPTSNGVLFAAADCTGHGVPGAMVSVVCSNALNRAVKEFDLIQPADVLNKTRELVIETFEGSNNDIKDGMDIALCLITYSNDGASLTFAGANNPIWILRDGASEMEEIKGDKQPIGKYETNQSFSQHEIALNSKDTVYVFSDGYADQFGGEKGKKLKYKPLKEILIEIQDQSMDQQREILLEKFHEWKGEFEQVDDVTMIGVRIV